MPIQREQRAFAQTVGLQLTVFSLGEKCTELKACCLQISPAYGQTVFEVNSMAPSERQKYFLEAVLQTGGIGITC